MNNNKKKGNGYARLSPQDITLSNSLPEVLRENYEAQQRIVQGTWYQGYFGHRSSKAQAKRMFKARGLPLRHFVCHANSMSWGDMSAESADLALSILWRHYEGNKGIGVRRHVIEVELDGRTLLSTERGKPALLLHMDFLREVVSRWPNDRPWLYTTKELEEWIAGKILSAHGLAAVDE